MTTREALRHALQRQILGGPLLVDCTSADCARGQIRRMARADSRAFLAVECGEGQWFALPFRTETDRDEFWARCVDVGYDVVT